MVVRKFSGGVVCDHYLALKGELFFVSALNGLNGVH
jgi:hypothetical protein